MLTVHHLEHSRSQRILWLLEELGVPYAIERYQRNRQTNLAPPELLAVHPLGKSPVIVDQSLVVAESGAIVEYLVEQYGGGAGGAWRPAAGSAAHRDFVYWMHFAEGSAMPPLLMKLIFDKVKSSKMPFFAKPIAHRIADRVLNSFVLPNIGKQLAYMNLELSSRPWFCGEQITAADIQMSFPLEAAAARGGLSAKDHPHLHDWLGRIHARPAYQRALERGGPYALLS